MSNDEIQDLRRKNNALEARLEAMTKRQNRLFELLIGEERDPSEPVVDESRNFFDRIADLEDTVQDVEQSAKAAIAQNAARADGGETTKKEIAQNEARNELVRLAAKARGNNHQVTVGDVQQQARPQTELAYQTVKDAFYDLQTGWNAFRVDTNEQDQRVLRVDEKEVSRELTVTVEESLGRDDLTKELISENRPAGGSA